MGGEDRLGFDILNGRMAVAADAATADAVATVIRAGMRAEPRGEDCCCRRRRVGAEPLHRVDGRERLLALHGAGRPCGPCRFSRRAPRRIAQMAAGVRGGGAPRASSRACRRCCRRRGLRPSARGPDLSLLRVVAVRRGRHGRGSVLALVDPRSVKCRPRRAVAALKGLTPPTVRLVRPDGCEEVPPDRLPFGARCRVRPGGRIPLDGRAVEGSGGVAQPRSPARACRSRRGRATRRSPARSTGTPRWSSSPLGPRRTRPRGRVGRVRLPVESEVGRAGASGRSRAGRAKASLAVADDRPACESADPGTPSEG